MSERADEPPIPWRRIVEEAPVAVSVIGPSGNQIAWNLAFAELFGYSADEVDHLDVSAITRPDDQRWTRTYLDRLASGQIDRWVTDKTYVRRDGSTFTGRLTSRAIRDEYGVCSHLIGTISPVETRIKIGVEQVRRMLGFANDTLTLIDAHGNVLETTGRYFPVLGYPSEFWETRTIFDLIERDEVDRVLALREDLMREPGGEIETEITVKAADGDDQILHIHAFNALADPDVQAIVIVSHNVTEHRRALTEIARAKRRAEAHVDSQTRLLATVSHELRNPLHAAHGLADLLATDDLPPHAAELVNTLRRQLKSLSQVTDDLLDAARLEGGRLTMHPTPTDLGELVGDVVQLAKASVINAGKAGSLDVSGRFVQGAPDWVVADPDRLRQVVSNLVGNAVKFTDAGSIQVVVRADGDDTVISVIDTGVGIPADEHETVLQPFGVGSTGGGRHGAGLGLSVVQRIVHAMGGTLTMTSAPGRGTCFDIRVAFERAARPMPIAEAAPIEGLRVLVVEDNPVNQQLAERQLTRLGMLPTIVGSGEEALAVLTSGGEGFGVVLMDQQLPGMSGTETTRAIRHLGDAVASVPVIGVSASASSADRDAFTSAGMNTYIAKPASLGDLSAAIAAVVATTPGHGAGDVRDEHAGGDGHGVADDLPVDVQGVPGVDVAVLEQLASELGGRDVVAGLIHTYCRELDHRLAAILDPAAHGADAKAVAHTLKSSSRLVGAVALGDTCAAIERSGDASGSGIEMLVERARVDLLRWAEQALV